MERLDGHAIAGMLHEHFGTEMTAANGRCRQCGAEGAVAELLLYTRAPGAVARCPKCGQVVMVLVEIRGELRVDTRGLELL